MPTGTDRDTFEIFLPFTCYSVKIPRVVLRYACSSKKSGQEVEALLQAVQEESPQADVWSWTSVGHMSVFVYRYQLTALRQSNTQVGQIARMMYTPNSKGFWVAFQAG